MDIACRYLFGAPVRLGVHWLLDILSIFIPHGMHARITQHLILRMCLELLFFLEVRAPTAIGKSTVVVSDFESIEEFCSDWCRQYSLEHHVQLIRRICELGSKLIIQILPCVQMRPEVIDGFTL